MVAPRALVFRPLVKGNEDFGNEIASNFSRQPERTYNAKGSQTKRAEKKQRKGATNKIENG